MPVNITRVPDRYQKGFAAIKTLSPDAVSAIIAAIDKPTAQLDELPKAVEQAAKMGSSEASNIVSSLRSLYVYKASAEETTAPEIVQALVGAMQSSGTLADTERSAFEENLTRLLNVKGFERITKVEQLKEDYDSVLYDAKILTDLRPVFDQPNARPIGAIITHTLKIVCHQTGEHKELYFSLDSKNIATLARIAERATEKMNSLKALLTSANIADLSE